MTVDSREPLVSDKAFKAPEELRQRRVFREPKLLVRVHQRINPPQDGLGLHLDETFGFDLIMDEEPQGGRLAASGNLLLPYEPVIPERMRPHQAGRGGLLPFMGDLM